MVAAGEGQVNAFIKDALREAWRTLTSGERRLEDPWVVAVAVDQALGNAGVAALSEAEREALLGEVRAGIGRGPMSAGARAEREMFEMLRRVRARFDIPELLEVLLAT